MQRKTIAVSGMSCDGCEENVENALGTVEGVSRTNADHENDTVEVVINEHVSDDDLSAAIRDAGYDVAS
ncbi:MAG: heavy-metal-associated domain-containing protein [Halopenitus sp.]